MKYLLPLTLILLVLSVLLNFRQCSSAKDEESKMLENNSRLQTEIRYKRAQIARRNITIDSIKTERRISDSTFRVAEKGLELRVVTLRKTIASMRPEIAPQIDSLPIVKTFIALQDSTILKQDSLNVVLSGHLYDQSKSFTTELEQKDLQLQATNQTSDLWREAAENAEKQTRREKRKTKFWKIASGVITLGAIFLIAK